MPNRLRAWLEVLDVQEMNVNLGFVSFKIGKKKPATPTGEAGPKPIEPPDPQPEPEPGGDVVPDPTPDPLLVDEPEPDAVELEHPINLEGSAFEQRLRTNKEVAKRLRHGRDEYIAERAVTYFIVGYPNGDDYERGRPTWKRIRAECQELIIATLDQHHQRATYGALAGIVGGLARSVMSGKPKVQRNSWIVSVDTHLPTGYPDNAKHPNLTERDPVLETPNQLREWLRSLT
jgi:hypothetical protein